MIRGDMRHYSNGRKKKYNAWSTSTKKPEFVEGVNPIPSYTYRRGITDHIPSLNSREHDCTKVESKQYTGTLVKGISTMHKSNSVPIIGKEDAMEHASMRR